LFFRQARRGHDLLTFKNREKSEVVCFMFFMKNMADVLSVHPTEIYGQIEREISEKIAFFMAASV
jgi:hypothetical protein